MPDIAAGKGLHADASAIIGYRSSRAGPAELALGADAVIRSGTVVYLGSRIGARFQAGHNVVIREECEIGDDVSVWSNSVIDYGCRIGDRVKIHSNCYVAQFSEIADGAFLAPGVTFANDLYPGQASSAAVMSGLFSTLPAVAEKFPGVMAVESPLKKILRGPSELKNSI